MRAADLTLCIDPFSRHFERDRLFDCQVAAMSDHIMAPHRRLREWFERRGVAVHTADRLARREVGRRVNVLMSFGLRDRSPELARRDDVVPSAFFAFEPPVVEPGLYRDLPVVARVFTRVLSFADRATLDEVGAVGVHTEPFMLPYGLDGVDDALWTRTERKHLVLINNNKVPAFAWRELYTERLNAIEFFGPRGELDLFGRGWDGPSFQPAIGRWPGTAQRLWRFGQQQWQRVRPVPALQAARRVWRGVSPAKLPVLSEYTFSICFENAAIAGYVSEKIFDCFVAGTVPIYLGAPDIEQHVPADCFVDMRRFGGYDELRRFLADLTPAAVSEYRDAARAFMRSPRFRPFSVDAFIDRIASFVETDTGVSLRNAA